MSHVRQLARPRHLELGALLCAGLLAALAHHPVRAQTLYRSVGPDGRITFSDKPPSAAAKVTPLSADSKDAAGANTGLPYELRQVVGKYPVTLFSGKECQPCDEGRTLLRSRGVPFSEKTINSFEDAESLKRLSDSTSLPVLSIGSQQLKGYSSTEWNQYLSAAGYPEKSRLPAAYRRAEPSPLVTAKSPATAVAPPAEPDAGVKPAAAAPPSKSRATADNPAGIQF
jgi:glutaredoxin